jgi:hypothetical protein
MGGEYRHIQCTSASIEIFATSKYMGMSGVEAVMRSIADLWVEIGK